MTSKIIDLASRRAGKPAGEALPPLDRPTTLEQFRRIVNEIAGSSPATPGEPIPSGFSDGDDPRLSLTRHFDFNESAAASGMLAPFARETLTVGGRAGGASPVGALKGRRPGTRAVAEVRYLSDGVDLPPDVQSEFRDCAQAGFEFYVEANGDDGGERGPWNDWFRRSLSESAVDGLFFGGPDAMVSLTIYDLTGFANDDAPALRRIVVGDVPVTAMARVAVKAIKHMRARPLVAYGELVARMIEPLPDGRERIEVRDLKTGAFSELFADMVPIGALADDPERLREFVA